MFNSKKVIRGDATKSWKLAAILDFGGHLDFSYLTAWNSDQNCFSRSLPSNWYWKRNFCIKLKWLSTWAPHY